MGTVSIGMDEGGVEGQKKWERGMGREGGQTRKIDALLPALIQTP